MRNNRTKTKLQQDLAVFGVISGVTDPKIAELIGLNGFDYYMMDAEHGPITPAQAVNIVRACETVGVTPLARVSQRDAKAILPYLDAGVMGIMMPGLETADQVADLVAAIKYAPLGRRGVGLSRASDYLMGRWSQAAYIEWANANTLVLPQFEDVMLLGKLGEMTAVPGVDGIVIGPRDLALSMGFADGANHPEVQQVIEEAIGIIRKAGLVAGITAGTAESAQAQMDRGATIILNSVPNLVRISSQSFLQHI